MTTALAAEMQIPKRWQPLLRALWLFITVLLFALYFGGLEPTYNEFVELCQAETCPMMTIASSELRLLQEHGFSQHTFALYYFVLEGALILLFCALAGLIFWRRSDTWIGLIVSQAMLFTALVFFAEEPRALARAYPEIQLFVDFLTSLSVVLLLMLFYIFPDGRFTPRWMRWFAAALILVVVLDPVFNQSGLRAYSATLLVIIAFAIGAPLGLFSQVYRFRNVSTQTQRQQTKWIVAGFVGMFLGMLPWMIFGEIAPLQPGLPRLIFYLSLIPQYLFVSLFPIAVTIAMLRYRLWEIDLVIRRTLQYTLLTGLLALTYLGGVVTLQGILGPLTGSVNSPLITVITTLGIAALFNPLRLRIQNFIDRRFYRQKYDAEQALARFAAIARDEVELEKLTAALLGVVEETVQPERASLWLRQYKQERK